MSKLLICPKSNGNTFNVCSYISEKENIDLKILNSNEKIILSKYNKIILSTGVYGGRPHSNLVKWLKSIDKEDIAENTEFFIFMTWFGRGKSDKNVIKKINSLLKKVDKKLEDNYITCLGKNMLIIRYKHPNKLEFKEVLNWIKNI